MAFYTYPPGYISFSEYAKRNNININTVYTKTVNNNTVDYVYFGGSKRGIKADTDPNLFKHHAVKFHMPEGYEPITAYARRFGIPRHRIQRMVCDEKLVPSIKLKTGHIVIRSDTPMTAWREFLPVGWHKKRR